MVELSFVRHFLLVYFVYVFQSLSELEPDGSIVVLIANQKLELKSAGYVQSQDGR